MTRLEQPFVISTCISRSCLKNLVALCNNWPVQKFQGTLSQLVITVTLTIFGSMAITPFRHSIAEHLCISDKKKVLVWVAFEIKHDGVGLCWYGCVCFIIAFRVMALCKSMYWRILLSLAMLLFKSLTGLYHSAKLSTEKVRCIDILHTKLNH